MRKCASEVCGCHVLGCVCAAPVSFHLTAQISVDTYFIYEWLLQRGTVALILWTFIKYIL
jgi:hypothetical protein